MLNGMRYTRSRSHTVLLAVLTALFVLSLLLFPELAFQSSMKGLSLWWNIVFPALLPFLILSELLDGFGFIRGAGVLFDPIMRLLFRLPGASGWAIAMGSLAGSPAGAQIAGQLRSNGTVNREQGERLLGLSHMSSPFLMLSVIGAGFLHRPAAGLTIAIIHYAAAIGAALIMLLRKSAAEGAITPEKPPGSAGAGSTPREIKSTKSSKSVWVRFVREMHEARVNDGRSFGKLLGDAVSSSVTTLMLIGGCIMMFSVGLHALELSLVTPAVNEFLQYLLHLAGYLGPNAPDWLPSLLELHLGAYSFSQLAMPETALVWKVALIGFALGWSGISQHLQVQAIVRHTDMRYWPFLLQRLVHGVLAFLLTFALWKPLQALMPRFEPSFLRSEASLTLTASSSAAHEALAVWQAVPGRMEEMVVALAALALLSLLIGYMRSRLR